jgi:hypothetical protein
MNKLLLNEPKWDNHDPILKGVRMCNDYGAQEAWRVCWYKMHAHPPGPGHEFWGEALIEVGRIMKEENDE